MDKNIATPGDGGAEDDDGEEEPYGGLTKRKLAVDDEEEEDDNMDLTYMGGKKRTKKVAKPGQVYL